jgi:hypothetical protein
VAVQAADGGAYGAGQATAVDVLFYEVRDDLRVRLGGEDVPAAAELGAQLFVVLDDAVEDDGDVVWPRPTQASDEPTAAAMSASRLPTARTTPRPSSSIRAMPAES